MPTETLGRALKSCQLVLEGKSQAVTNQTYFQSAVQTTVRVLDSILYLTSKDIHTYSQYILKQKPTQTTTLTTDEFIFFTPCVCVNIVSSQSEDGLQRRVCALLSLPWVCENKSASAYKSSGFPSWLSTLAQRLSFCYCEFYCCITTLFNFGLRNRYFKIVHQ